MQRLLSIVERDSAATLKSYRTHFRAVKIDPLDYAEMCVRDPRGLEIYLLNWRKEYASNRPRGGSMRQILSTLKRASDYCGGTVRWRLITTGTPKPPKEEDIETPKEAVRKIHERGDKRLHFLNYLLYS